MSRLATTFARLQTEGRKALIPFITAGDPDPVTTVPLLHSLVRGGADILELGVPFSDPMADGPVIQRAHERALVHRVSLRQVLAMVQTFRQDDSMTPVVLMGYLNPLEVMGYEVFAAAAAAAGVDGLITVDLPPEEATPLVIALTNQGIDPIFLVAPTSPAARMAAIGKVAGGFVYYVSLKGVTGAATLDLAEVASRVAELRRYTPLPVGVGFGIRDAASAAAIATVADGVVVGSAVVSRVEQYASRGEAVIPPVQAFLAELRQALDGVVGGV